MYRIKMSDGTIIRTEEFKSPGPGNRFIKIRATVAGDESSRLLVNADQILYVQQVDA